MLMFGIEFADRLAKEHPKHFPAVLSESEREFIDSCSSKEFPVHELTIKPGMMVVYQAMYPHCWTTMKPNTMSTHGKVLTYSTLELIVKDSTEMLMEDEEMAYIYVAYVVHALYKAVSAFDLGMLKDKPTREQMKSIVETMERLIQGPALISFDFEKEINAIWDGSLELKIVKEIIFEWL